MVVCVDIWRISPSDIRRRHLPHAIICENCHERVSVHLVVAFFVNLSHWHPNPNSFCWDDHIIMLVDTFFAPFLIYSDFLVAYLGVFQGFPPSIPIQSNPLSICASTLERVSSSPFGVNPGIFYFKIFSRAFVPASGDSSKKKHG